jgi:hypothetical protein
VFLQAVALLVVMTLLSTFNRIVFSAAKVGLN